MDFFIDVKRLNFALISSEEFLLPNNGELTHVVRY